MRRLLSGTHTDPHRILGAHPAAAGDKHGVVVRAFHPDAVAAECLLRDGTSVPLPVVKPGIFAAFLPDASLPLRYELRFQFGAGGAGRTWQRGDPYRFLPTMGELDLHLFNEGTHRTLWERMGAHPGNVDGEDGVAFAVWAPNARGVSVIGDFTLWDGRLLPMRLLGGSGVWELFVPGIRAGALYKYEIHTNGRLRRVKTDPFASSMELPPATAARVAGRSEYAWGDAAWTSARAGKDHTREPMLIYEVHLGSWARVLEEGNRCLTYREIAPLLVNHLLPLGFTHVELLPVAEHPFTGSWGYQVTGYYAPTARYGTPDDFRFFVDTLHKAGIGVLLDWVPAHFPKDDFALRRFDGTALYEHEDPRLGEHPDWGTLIFNYGRKEVRNFLIANALYWLSEFHIDGLRVDAVASMLYLDYSRKEGEWLRNVHGGRENLEATSLFKELNEIVRLTQPGCMMIAEESTAWPAVTKPAGEGGLGFTFKWNMGWMHDTLKYFALDPLFRRDHQNELTFAMLYEYSERFVNPLSHDEVVHGKRSLLEKMPGDKWKKFANLRILIAYQFTRPGKALVFMGTELAPSREWDHDTSLDWHLTSDPLRAGFLAFMRELGTIYRANSPFWRRDPDFDGYAWIDVGDHDNSVVSYMRRDDDSHAVVVFNLTPVPRENYRVGAPQPGSYREIMSTDSSRFGGSGFATLPRVKTEAARFHGFPQSMLLNLPPLGALILVPDGSEK
ncbi:MAG: 1,4-alpha-glucan branching protein GlgB [Gemmatimonadaceae bacterium]